MSSVAPTISNPLIIMPIADATIAFLLLLIFMKTSYCLQLLFIIVTNLLSFITKVILTDNHFFVKFSKNSHFKHKKGICIFAADTFLIDLSFKLFNSM